ncbi:MAG: CDP-alcohol phosphatidyltransferase family protein [Limnochordia bacterium]|jgi:hypothetical protein|nr:CDP-alcohol phosphatidyltransferase family protein [Limnochordia bacterium]MDD2630144.1 CDP-alcohol phosphatidyltransferase family protein [Limnochordia bacterium]MDD4518864.1 CDP-alcohol phosphatidyltransferase family protein [Limnochordia bacterium]
MGKHADKVTPSELYLRQSRPLLWVRALADLLTLSRLIGGVALALMSWERTVSSLGRLVKYNMILWSTDMLDGKIARRSQTPPSWIGERDAWIDAILTLGTSIALTRSGYLPGKLVAAWLGICLVSYAIRPVATIVLVFMCPLQLTLPVLAFVHHCPEVRMYFIWVAAVAFFSRKRLKWVIEVFINGLPDQQREWVWSWLPSWLKLTPEEREFFAVSLSPDAASHAARGARPQL